MKLKLKFHEFRNVINFKTLLQNIEIELVFLILSGKMIKTNKISIMNWLYNYMIQ